MMPAAAALAINQVSLWNEYNKMVIFGCLRRTCANSLTIAGFFLKTLCY